MISLSDLTKYLDKRLDIDDISEDMSNNGLQIEGFKKVQKIIFAVDACLELGKIAAKEGSDFIFVHHGLSWRNGFKKLTGHSAQIFSTLFKNDISLYAAHLPLDSHAELGHNIQIANMLEINNPKPFCEYANVNVGIMGELPESTKAKALSTLVDKKLNTESKIFGNIDKEIFKVGIISGGPGSMGIEAAYENNLDCLITGELGHSSWHLINDLNLTVITGGHYRTEVPGVMAVMDEINNKFDVECQFVDLPTGL